MSDTLIDILARDYGLDTAEATELLEALGRRLREQAETGDSVDLPHVGTIKKKNDHLTLAPREDVLDALARRHGDLTKLQWSVPEPPASEDTPAEAEAATGLEFAPTPSDSSSPETVTTEPASSSQPEDAAESSLPPSPRRSHRRSSEPQSESSARVWWAVLLALVLVLAGALLTFIFVYDGSVANLPFSVPGITEQTTPQETPPSASSDTTQALLPADPSTADTAATTTADDPAAASPAIDVTAGGWTIIVGAYPSRAEADSMLDVFQSRLTDVQAPIDTLTATAEASRFRFRVAVGQYETQADANAARRSLGDQLPGDAWILRLQ
jgi:hypothetical protein